MADSPMAECEGATHDMRPWPEGLQIMAMIGTDNPMNTAAITEPEHCVKCGSIAFVLRGAERIYVPNYEKGKAGRPIRRPIV